MKAYITKHWAPLTVGLFVGIALVLMSFGASHSLWRWQLKPDQGRIWDIILKAFAGAVGIVGAIITAFKYIDDKALQRGRDLNEEARQKDLDRREDAKQRAIDRKEERKIRIQEKQAVYRRLGSSLANIMNHDPDDERDAGIWNDAKEKFYELYWGEIPFVADDEVMASVEQFSNVLHGARTRAEKDAFADHVSAITDACRKSLDKTWDEFHRTDPEIGSTPAPASGVPLSADPAVR